MLDSGTDVNDVDDDDTTALQVASANGHEYLVRYANNCCFLCFYMSLLLFHGYHELTRTVQCV